MEFRYCDLLPELRALVRGRLQVQARKRLARVCMVTAAEEDGDGPKLPPEFVPHLSWSRSLCVVARLVLDAGFPGSLQWKVGSTSDFVYATTWRGPRRMQLTVSHLRHPALVVTHYESGIMQSTSTADRDHAKGLELLRFSRSVSFLLRPEDTRS